MNRILAIFIFVLSGIAPVHAAFTLDWSISDATVLGTNFTVNLAVDEGGGFSVVSTASLPANMEVTASGSTGLSQLTNKTFSLSFSSINGQDFKVHSPAGSCRIGMVGGVNAYRFDDPAETARITADLTAIESNVRMHLVSVETLNAVSDFVIGLKDSSGVEELGATNQNELAELSPLLSGQAIDYFEYRAVSGSAGGWGSLVFEFGLANAAETPIQLSNIFSSGCVLQRDQKVPVWGTCEPGETLTVSVNAQSKQTVADANGNWRVELEPESAGGPYTLTVSGAISVPVVLSNVYFGDVWLLTGQSNMFLLLGSHLDGFPEYYPALPDASDDFDDMRFAIVNVEEALVPADEVVMNKPWNRWEASQLSGMSSVGYFFARQLNDLMDANGMGDVPLGFIKVCKGATAAEQWASADALAAMDEALIADDGKPASIYYNGMIAPLQDYAVKGALWYQGEGNSRTIERSEQYPLVWRTLVESWREQWGIDFPVYYVQLAPYMNFVPVPADDDTNLNFSNWAWIRESQAACRAVENTEMACIIDRGFQDHIHPPYKDVVGQRLARIALADTYGLDIVSRGPSVADVAISNSIVLITFDNVANGLRTQAVDAQPDDEEIAEGFLPVSVSSNVLAGFALCGVDQTFCWATEAEIVGTNQVRISNAVDVPNPVAVRYAWQSYPRCNLFNSEGLPAEPFRTDAYDYETSSGAELSQPPVGGFLVGTNLTLEWPPVPGDWALVANTNFLATNWVEVSGSRSQTSVQVAIGAVEKAGFFKLKR